MSGNEYRGGKFDVLFKRIEGETVPGGAPAFAMATYEAIGASSQPEQLTGIMITSGTYSASQTSAQYENPLATGLYLMLYIYALPSSGTLQLFLDVYNPADADYSCFWQGGEITATGSATGTRKYLIYPGAVDDQAQFTLVDRIPMPMVYRLRANIGGALDWTYCVGYQYVGL